MVLQNQPLD